MNKKLIIAIVAFVALIVCAGGFLLFAFHSIEIEDTYGNNQDIYYNSREGDIVVNHYRKGIGRIAKTWTRFYIINKNDTLDVYEWWDDQNIEIYRGTRGEISVTDLDHEDLKKLLREEEIKLVRKLR